MGTYNLLLFLMNRTGFAGQRTGTPFPVIALSSFGGRRRQPACAHPRRHRHRLWHCAILERSHDSDARLMDLTPGAPGR